MNYLSYAEITLACTIAGTAGGWAVGHYGVSSLTAELTKVKDELEALKNRIFPNAQVPVVVAAAN